MQAKTAINGFGRIGRMVLRKAMTDHRLDVVAINARYPSDTLAHLVKYDSIHGPYNGEVRAEEDALIIDGKRIRIVNSRDPEQLPWRELGVHLVIEATGKFRDREAAAGHLRAGAEKVIITAPGKQEDVTIVMGVNENEYDNQKHAVISNASCTTNCLAPIVKVLDDRFGIENGMMTTVHSYTNDQKNIDNPHKDLRRARACGQSIIPTTTGAAQAISKVLPHLEGKLTGMALRIPTPNVSLIDLVVDLKQTASAEQINREFRKASTGPLKGILGYTDEPLVSIDFNGDERSSIIDALSTQVIGERKVKVLAWYDNEWGYSCRVVDLAGFIAGHIAAKVKVHAS
ncbi:MAG TPA: glyceraldehyde-3-phosphate dehydrogenase [Bacillales bacterium]|nr:glyceraldehyde-3-phosphate dehydrogenase [Bacillales bacterium]